MGAPLRVLVVDDNEMVRMILGDAIADLGHQVVAEASDSEAAQKAYAEHKPDLVTLDLSLSVSGAGDGMSVLKALLGRDAKARIIVISGNAQQRVQSGVLAAGALGFVSKPINKDELSAAIAKAMK